MSIAKIATYSRVTSDFLIKLYCVGNSCFGFKVIRIVEIREWTIYTI